MLVSTWCLYKYSLTKHLPYFPVTAGLFFSLPKFCDSVMTDIITLELSLDLEHKRSLIKIFVE